MGVVRNRTKSRIAWRVAAGLAVTIGVLSPASLAGANPSVRASLPVSRSICPSGAQIAGPAASTAQVRVDVALKVPDPAALQAFVRAVSTPGSPQYRQYVAKGQFANKFGPSAAAISSVRSWLTASGLAVGPTTGDGLLIPASGTTAVVEAAFDTTISNVRLSNGRTSYATLQTPSVPESVAGAVSGILGLDNYPDQPAPADPVTESHRGGPESEAAPAAGLRGAQAMSRSGIPVPAPCLAAESAINTNTGNRSYTQTAIARLYGFTTLYGQGRLGYGQTIALVEEESYTAHEIQTFEQCYGLTNPVRQVVVDGGGSPYQEGEAVLDIEQVAAMAPGATIVSYDGSGITANLIAIADADSAGVVSASLGGCEADETSAQFDSQSVALEQLAAQGQTVVVAAGDSGSEACSNASGAPELGVNDPASQPDVLSAGGTMLPLPSANPPTSGDQTTWNNCFGRGSACPSTIRDTGAGGGGLSSHFAMPSWQQDAGHGTVNRYSSGSPCHAPAGSFCRELPDVSAYADQRVGYSVYTDPLYFPVNGKLRRSSRAAGPPTAGRARRLRCGPRSSRTSTRVAHRRLGW